MGTLNWLQMGILLRWVFREVALIILLDRALDLTTLQMAAFVLGLVGLHAIRVTYSALVIYVGQRRRLPVIARNVNLGSLRIPDPHHNCSSRTTSRRSCTLTRCRWRAASWPG